MQTEFSDVMRSVCVCVNHVALASPLPVVALSMEWSWLGAGVWCFKLEHPYAPFAQTSDGISYRDCAITFDMLRNHPILRFHCQLRCEKPRWSAWRCWRSQVALLIASRQTLRGWTGRLSCRICNTLSVNAYILTLEEYSPEG